MKTPRSLVTLPWLLLLAGCASTGASHIQFDSSDWHDGDLRGRHITTDHFDIYSTLRDQPFEEALPAYIEAVYEQFVHTIRPPKGAAERMVFYVFGLRGEWEAFTLRRFPRRAPIYVRIHSGGYTEGNVSALFHRTRGGTLATLAHEGWHQYVSSRFSGPIPAWLNEGLGCYHESFDCAGPKPRFTPTRNTFRLDTLREAIRKNELLPLDTVVQTDAGRVLSERGTRMAEIYYAQAWSLVIYLRHLGGQERRRAFQQMLDDIAGGSFGRKCSATRLLTGASPNAGLGELAVRAYFDVAPSALESDYRAHLLDLLD